MGASAGRSENCRAADWQTLRPEDTPLLVSVRSGAKFSMPGMMDTVLNLDINDETVQGLVEQTGDERFAYDAYRRFIQMFSKIVLSIDPQEFEQVRDQYKERAGVKNDAEIPALDSGCSTLPLFAMFRLHKFPEI